jgi:hypothetical protein
MDNLLKPRMILELNMIYINHTPFRFIAKHAYNLSSKVWSEMKIRYET